MKGNGYQIGAQIAQRNGTRIGKNKCPPFSIFILCLVYIHVFKRLVVFFKAQTQNSLLWGFQVT